MTVLTLTVALLAGAPSRSLRAQEPAPRLPGPVLGIVEVPRLFGSVTPDGRLLPPEGPLPLVLRREPVPGSTAVARVASAAGLESTEYASEAAGALVYGRDGGWTLLRTPDGTSGWMAPDEAEAERFMSGAWGPAPRSVRVLAFRRIGGRLWVEVEMLEDSPCETLDEPEVVARGWIPAHDDAGAPHVWFHSRGC